MKKEGEIVENRVYQFRISIDEDAFGYPKHINIPVNPNDVERYIVRNPNGYLDLCADEDEVSRQYFTAERIAQLKEALIKSIQDCENPFRFICYSTDADWNYTEKDLFKIV